MTEKKYYNLKEVEGMVDLKTRALKYRMLKVKVKYKERNDLLIKTKKSWKIHESIIFEFDRKKLSKEEQKRKENSLVTISPDGNYEVQALKVALELIHEKVKAFHPNVTFYFFIQQGEKGKLNHIHFLTNLKPNFQRKIYRITQDYVKSNVDMRPVYEVRGLIEYLRNEALLQGPLS